MSNPSLSLNNPTYYAYGVPSHTPDDWVGMCISETAGTNEWVTVTFSATPYTGGGVAVGVVSQGLPGGQSGLFARSWATNPGWSAGTPFVLGALVQCRQFAAYVATATVLG